MKPRAKTFWLSRGRPFSRTHYSHSFGVSTCHLQAHLAQDTVKTTKRYFSSIQFFTLRFLFTDNKSRTTHIQVGTRWCRKQISQARTPGENEAFTPAQQTQIDFGKQEYIRRPRGRNLHIVATCATRGPFLGRRSQRLAACAAVCPVRPAPHRAPAMSFATSCFIHSSHICIHFAILLRARQILLLDEAFDALLDDDR